MIELQKHIVLLLVVVQLGQTLILPPEYQQKLQDETNGIQKQHQNQQIELINDFVEAKDKFNSDWDSAASEADLKIEKAKNRVIEEYTTNQLNSVKNYWNSQNENNNAARESDDFIDSYLRGSEKPIEYPQLKSEILADAVESDNYIQSYLGITGPSIHEKFISEKDVIDSAAQSDQFIQTYLDGDRFEENEFQKKTKVIEDAAKSDIFLEKYLL